MLAAIFAEAHVRLLSFKHFLGNHPIYQVDQASQGVFPAELYTLLMLQLFIESLPLVVAAFWFHQHCFSQPVKSIGVLILGFGVYPLMHMVLAESWPAMADIALLSIHGWLLALGATLLWWLQRLVRLKSSQKSHTALANMLTAVFSLNGVILTLLLLWALFMSGIFNSTVDPMRNMPLNPLIDVTRIGTEFMSFMHYLWQFTVMAGVMFCHYWVIRQVLIKELLAKEGIVAFVFASIIWLVIATPVLSGIVLLLPINIDSMTMLPSTDWDVFGRDNYAFMFILLIASTPLILGFDRQKQTAQLAQSAQQQTQTELKLLQQQINPHFLFNTLNNLYALTLKKSPQAPDLIMQLSDLLRYTVYQGQQDSVALQDEIDYLTNFIELQKIRLGTHATISTNWPKGEQIESCVVAPLLFIILVENAFKHGIENHSEHSDIAVNMSISDERILTFVCENSHAESQAAAHTSGSATEARGLGLQNLQRRLELQYGGKFQLTTGPVQNDNDQKENGQNEKGQKIWRAKLEITLS